MSTVKPSEKTGHEGEWWRTDHGDEPILSDHLSKDAANTPDDSGEMRKEKWDQEQFPYKHPV
ncbi:MAG TPA: hypothetical protein VKX16_06325 [Chloroflexota bacterium]|nr:hypothetical protein [Chloroflexota bacterium]